MLSVSVYKNVPFMYTRDLALHRSLAGSVCARLEREEERSASAAGDDGAVKGSAAEADAKAEVDEAGATALGAARLRLDGWATAVAAIEAARGGAAAMAEADGEETEKKKEEDDAT